jgi:hypothetical protein
MCKFTLREKALNELVYLYLKQNALTIRQFATHNLFGLLATGLLVVVVVRAVLIPPYMDEIFTYFTYVQSGSFQPGYAHIDANNHLLNSLVTHLSFLVFGDELWSLRLPNVLAFVLYAYSANKIRLSFSDKAVGNAFAVAILASWYVLSFFSLSRGYGLSLALLLYACYQLIAVTQTPTWSRTAKGICSLVLASSANLTLLPLSIVITFLLTLFHVRHNSPESLIRRILFAASALVLSGIGFGYLYLFSVDLKESGLLYHGRSTGYFEAIFVDLPNELLQTQSGAQWGFGFLVALIVVGVVMGVRYKKFNSPAWILGILAILSLVLPVVFNELMLIPFPQGRTGLHYYILILLPAFLQMQKLSPLLSRALAWSISGILAFLFVTQFQLNYAPCWRDDTVPAEILTFIHTSDRKKDSPPTVAAHGILGKALQHQGYLNEKPTPFRELFEATYYEDFILTNRWNAPDHTENYDTVWHHPVTSVTLLKRNSVLQFHTLADTSLMHLSGSQEFQGLIQRFLRNKVDSPLHLSVHLQSEMLNPPFKLHLIAQVNDESHQVQTKGELEIQKLSRNRNGKMDIQAAITLSAPTQPGSEVEIYLWNPKSQPYHLDRLHIVLREITDARADK